MMQESASEADAAVQERPAARDRVAAWLRSHFFALQPRTGKHWALYAVLLLLALFVLFEWRSTTTYSVRLQVTEEARNVIGLAPYYEDRLDFGDLPRGSAASMKLTLQNEGRIPSRFTIIATGDVRQFIRISDAFFTLSPGDAKSVEFTIAVPRTAEPKKYTGNIHVVRTPWVPWP